MPRRTGSVSGNPPPTPGVAPLGRPAAAAPAAADTARGERAGAALDFGGLGGETSGRVNVVSFIVSDHGLEPERREVGSCEGAEEPRAVAVERDEDVLAVRERALDGV